MRGRKNLMMNELYDACAQDEKDCRQAVEALDAKIRKHTASIQRLEKKKCTVENGAVFLTLLNDLERIADHFFNVAKSIKEYTQGIVVQTEGVIIK